MSDVTALENQLRDAKIFMERREKAIKLASNPEFKELILDGFCLKECARYAQNSADPALSPEQRADALALAQAAGHLRRYLNIMVVMGNNAEGNLKGIEDAIEEARLEEAAEEAE